MKMKNYHAVHCTTMAVNKIDLNFLNYHHNTECCITITACSHPSTCYSLKSPLTNQTQGQCTITD